MELVVNPPQEVFDQLIEQAAKTDGWAHMPYDYDFWKNSFDGYWFFAILDTSKDSSSNFVSGASLARWDAPNEAPLFSIGVFYTVAEYRGKGYGRQIFDEMMKIVGDSNACLTAAIDMSEKYAKVFGFNKLYNFWHYKATIIPSKIDFSNTLQSGDYCTKSWDTVDQKELEDYDLTICSRNRTKIMKNWMELEGTVTKVATDSQTTKIVGYGTIRPINLNRLLVGPFYADNLEIAGLILKDLVESIPDYRKFEKIIFWFPKVNQNMEKLLHQICPNDGVRIEIDYLTQFTKNLIESRDAVVYSVADSTHQFI